MELHLQNQNGSNSITIFLYYLDAFLGAARNVTWIFQKEFANDKRMNEWYEKKVQLWKKNKTMRLFVEMRNVSLKEHTPETLTFTINKGEFDTFGATREETPNGGIRIKIPIQKPGEKTLKSENQLRSSAVFFYKVPNWFDENPDVILLCRSYIEKLEEFVGEAEKMLSWETEVFKKRREQR